MGPLQINNFHIATDSAFDEQGVPPDQEEDVFIAIDNHRADDVLRLLSMGGLSQRIFYDQNGRTALHLAVIYGHEDVVGIFLGHIGDRITFIKSTDNEGKTPLSYAIEQRNLSILKPLVEVLIRHDNYPFPPDEECVWNVTALRYAEQLIAASDGWVDFDNREWGACYFDGATHNTYFDTYVLSFLKPTKPEKLQTLYRHAEFSLTSAIEWMLRQSYIDYRHLLAALQDARSMGHLDVIRSLTAPNVVLSAISSMQDISSAEQARCIRNLIAFGAQELALFEVLVDSCHTLVWGRQNEALALLRMMAKSGFPSSSAIETMAKRDDIYALTKLINTGVVGTSTIYQLQDDEKEGVADLIAYLCIENMLDQQTFMPEEKIKEIQSWLRNGFVHVLIELLQDCADRRRWKVVDLLIVAGVPINELIFSNKQQSDTPGVPIDFDSLLYDAVMARKGTKIEVLLAVHNKPVECQTAVIALNMAIALDDKCLLLLLLNCPTIRKLMTFVDLDVQRVLRHALIKKNVYAAAAIITAEGLVYSRKGYQYAFAVSESAMYVANQLMKIDVSLIRFDQRQRGECALIIANLCLDVGDKNY